MKKLLSYSLLLSSVVLSGFSLSQMEALADQTEVPTAFSSASHFNKENNHKREIGAFYNVTFRYPDNLIYVDAGTVEDFIPGQIILSVENGGPEALVWTAAVINERTGTRISEFVKFTHGYNALHIPIVNSDVRIGDPLTVVFNNDNFPEDQGPLQIYGGIFAMP